MDGGDAMEMLHLIDGFEHRGPLWRRLPAPCEEQARGIDATACDGGDDTPRARTGGVRGDQPTMRSHEFSNTLARSRQPLAERRRLAIDLFESILRR